MPKAYFYLLIAVVLLVFILIYVQQNNVNMVPKTNIDIYDPLTQLDGNRSFTYIKWLMLAGDSNMRKTFFRIIEKFEGDLKLPNSYLLNITHSTLGTAKDSRWFDRDFMLHFKNESLLRVSLRFLHGDYRELYRLNSHWTDIRFCFTECRTSVLPSRQRGLFNSTSKPDLLFITRGLWNIDSIHSNLSCYHENLYANIIKSLGKEVKLVWQNNPKIYWHNKIKNWQIEHDAECMRKYAKKYQLDIFDIFTHTSQNMTETMIKGEYHISVATRDYLHHMMWEKLWNS